MAPYRGDYSNIHSAAAAGTGQKHDGFTKRESESDYAANNDLTLSPAFSKRLRGVY